MLMEIKSLPLPHKHCMRVANYAVRFPVNPRSHTAGSHLKSVLGAEKRNYQSFTFKVIPTL